MFDDFLKGFDNLRQFLDSEQRLDNHSLYSQEFVQANFRCEIADQYRPENQKVFSLPYFLVPLEKTSEYCQMDPDESAFFYDYLFETINGKTYYPFFIHPTTLDFFLDVAKGNSLFVSREASCYRASATSSYRSLVVEKIGVSPFIVKVSLFVNITQGSRHIDWFSSVGQLESSMAFKSCLQDSSSWLPFYDIGALGFPLEKEKTLPEGLKVHFGPRKIAVLGNVIRKIPEDLLTNKVKIMSFAALTSMKYSSESLLSSLAKRSGLNWNFFLDKRLLKPLHKMLIDHWSENGLVVEPHCQNTLVVLNQNFELTGKYSYRDFDVSTYDRARFPFVKRHHWLTYLQGRPDRWEKSIQLSSRDGIIQGLHNHFIRNLVRPVVKSFKESMVISEVESIDFYEQFVRDWKESLFQILPRTLPHYLYGIDDDFLETGIISEIALHEIPVKLELLDQKVSKKEYLVLVVKEGLVNHKTQYTDETGYILYFSGVTLHEMWIPWALIHSHQKLTKSYTGNAGV